MLKIFTLKNGLTVIYSQRKALMSAAMSLRFHGGSMYEEDYEIGAAHFLEHVLFDGTEKYPSEVLLAQIVEEKGALRNGVTGKETVEYFVKILKEDVATAAEYLSQITMHPLLRGEDVEREKKIIEQEIHRYRSDPRMFSSRLVYSLLYPNSRLGTLNTGEIKDIQKLTRERLHAYHEKYYVAHNAILSIVADIPESEVLSLSEKYFGGMRAGEKNSSHPRIADSQIDTHIEIMLGVKQATLVIAFKTYTYSSRERFAIDLILRILTRGRSSRLMQKLRGEKGAAYDVSSEHVSSNNFGFLSIITGVSESRVAETIGIIKTEFVRISNEPPSREELFRAYYSIKSSLTFMMENPLEEASFNSYRACMSSPYTVSEELAQYQEVIHDPLFIQQTAKRVFEQQPAILLLAKEKQEIKW